MAGSKALKAAFEEGGATLLEPIYAMEIAVPTDVMGDVMGDLNSRRGQVVGMDTRGRNTIIQAHVPLAEVQRYAPDLKSMTGGKGTFTMQLDRYAAVPSSIAQRVAESSPLRRHSDDD